MSTSIWYLLNLEIQNMKTGLQTTPSQRKNTTEIIWIKLAAVLVFYLCHIALNKINRFFFGVLPSPPHVKSPLLPLLHHSCSRTIGKTFSLFIYRFTYFNLAQFGCLPLENAPSQLDLKLCICMRMKGECFSFHARVPSKFIRGCF